MRIYSSRVIRSAVTALLTVLVAVLCANPAAAQRPDYPPEIDSEKHVYKHVDNVDLNLWVFRPAEKPDDTSKPSPAIVFFFGGGWTSGTPAQFLPQAQYLQSRGMTAILVDYRVASRHKVKIVSCVEDAKSVIRWIRDHAEQLHIDPQRICAAGGSAGGHLACATSLLPEFDNPAEDLTVSSAPNALALFNPALMLAPISGMKNADSAALKMDALKARAGTEPVAVSPIHHVRGQLPPTVIFHGEADTTVPVASVKAFTRLMVAAGNRCELHTFRNAPHGFFNLREPRETNSGKPAAADKNASRKYDQHRQWHLRTLLQLDRFLTSLGWLNGEPTVPVVNSDNVKVRGQLQNSFHRFQTEKKGHVAFLGGSITEMEGYRPRVMEWLQKTFPDTQFTFTNAGIASTCSHTGAFRVHRDVLSQGAVDLLLVEFAVNDDQDARHSAEDCVRGMEGIIRHVREFNVKADIVMIDFVNPEMLALAQAGKTAISVDQHERVARHYQISSVDLPMELADRIAAQTMTWDTFGGTHPGPLGNQMAADLVADVLQAGWRSVPVSTQPPADHAELPAPLMENCFDHGGFLPSESVATGPGWTLGIPDWNSIEGSKRDRFLHDPIFYSTQPGSALRFSFAGHAVGAFVVAGPDAGQLEVQIDDGDWKTVELYHSYSSGLHYPRTVMFASGLPPGSHQVNVRLAASHHELSKGTAARILDFTISE